MSDETKSTWVLDLDMHSATEKAEHFLGQMHEIGDAESLHGLIGTLGEVGLALGAVGATIFALKETMDLVFEAENIRAINQQFELLSENAGVAGHVLKEGLIEASHGLIAETDLLKSANKALVEMGSNAEHLPDVMEVARKSTAAFGGDLSSNFEAINHAISTGSVRQLRHLGIILDQKKAYAEYAASIGVTAGELSKSGQQHAILNAVLEKGKTAFEGVNPDIKEAQNNFQQLKVAITEIKEVIILAFEKVAGPTLREFFNNLKGWAGEAKEYLTAQYGEGAEQAAAKTKQLNKEIMDIKGQLIDLDQKKVRGLDFAPGDTIARVTVLNQKLVQYQAELVKAEQKAKALHAADRGPAAEGGGGQAENDEIDQKKRLKNEAEFQSKILALKQKTLDDSLKIQETEEGWMRVHEQQIAVMKEQSAAEIDKINRDEHLKVTQKNQLRLQEEQSLANKLLVMNQDLEKKKIAALEVYLKESKTVSQGVFRAWETGAKKAEHEVRDFTNLGKQSFDAFNKNAQNAFIALGEGSQSAGDAMKGFMFGSLADIAQAQGALLLASAIVNPLNGVAGAALLVLSGFLRSQAKGAGAGAGVGAPSGGGEGNSSDYGFGTRTDERAAVGSFGGPSNLQSSAPRSTTSITVQGSLYNSEQTKTALLDIMRQASDATDFKYNQVGSGGP